MPSAFLITLILVSLVVPTTAYSAASAAAASATRKAVRSASSSGAADDAATAAAVMLAAEPKLEGLPAEVLSGLKTWLPARDVGNIRVSRKLKQHAVDEKERRIVQLESKERSVPELYKSLQQGVLKPPAWPTPHASNYVRPDQISTGAALWRRGGVEERRVEEFAQYYLDHPAPERAHEFFEVLIRNGIPLSGPFQLENGAAHFLLFDTALQMGRVYEAEEALSKLSHRGWVYGPDQHFISAGYSVPPLLLDRLNRQYLLQARTHLARGDADRVRDKLGRIMPSGASTDVEMQHQAIAMHAELPVGHDDRTLLHWESKLLDSPHLSSHQKHQVAYRLGDIYNRGDALDDASKYFRQVIENGDPQYPYYMESLNQLFDVNVRREAHAENLLLAYQALYQNKLPYSQHHALRERIFRQYGDLAQQQRIVAADKRGSFRVNSYLQLENARLALKHGETDKATETLTQLLNPARKDRLPEEVLYAAERYRKTVQLQRVQRLASSDPEQARMVLKEIMAEDAASLPRETPLLTAQHLAQRSLVHTELEDYAGAMDDLWSIMKMHRSRHDLYQSTWHNSPLEEAFNQGYEPLIARGLEAEGMLSSMEQHQLQLVKASLAVFNRQLGAAEEWLVALRHGLEAGAYSGEQQAFIHLLQARFYRALKDNKKAIASYKKALQNQEQLLPRDLTHAHLGLGIAYYFQRQYSPAIYHLRTALQRPLSINDLIVARNSLASAYLGTGNPEHLSEAIGLFFKALQDQKHHSARIRVNSAADLQKLNLQLARALERYSKYKKNSYYRDQSFMHYSIAEQLTEGVEKRLAVLKERTDYQARAYLSGEGIDSVKKGIVEAYETIIEKTKDSAVKARSQMSLGKVTYRQVSTRIDPSGRSRISAYRDAMKYYDEAHLLREHLSQKERALLDLKRGIARYELWGNSYDTNEQLRSMIEVLIQAALDSNTLKGNDLIQAHRYLGRLQKKYRNYRKAHEHYTYALGLKEGMTISDEFLLRQHRADVALAERRLEDALLDYDAIFEHKHTGLMRRGRYDYFRMLIRTKLDEKDYYNMYLMRAGILTRLGDLNKVLAELDRFQGFHNTRPLLNGLVVDQWLLGNTAEVKMLLQHYQKHQVKTMTDSREFFHVLNLAMGLQETPKKETLKELDRVVWAGGDKRNLVKRNYQEAIDGSMMEHQRSLFWQQVYQLLGEELLKAKKYSQAEAVLTKAAEGNATSRLYVSLAESVYAQKKYDSAQRFIGATRDRVLAPNMRRRRLGLLGHLARHRKDHETALRHYRAAEAVDAAGTSYRSLIMRLQAQQRMKKLKQAVRRKVRIARRSSYRRIQDHED